MDTGVPNLDGSRSEGKRARGWRLTKVSWELIRRDPTMVSLAMLGTGFGLAGAAALFYFSGFFNSPTHSNARLAVAGLIGIYPMTFVSVFFNVALAGAADASFEGRHLSVGEALAISWQRLGRIAQWSLLAAGVGIVLEQIASRIPGVGRIASCLAGAAWGLATIFAVPLLALEDRGPIEAAKESVHLVKSRWGEGVTGFVGIGAWTTVAIIPFVVLVIIGLATRAPDSNVGAGLIAVAFGGFFFISALGFATHQVFSVALYRYAIGIPAGGGFTDADPGDPFTRRGK